MAVAQKVAGYSLGAADLLRRAMGKKKKSELDAQYETFEAGMTRAGLLGRRGQGALGHPAAVLRLRLQQGPLRGVRRAVVLDRLPQGELPGRVHGRPADQRARRQGQVRALPRRVPPDGHQGAAAGRQRVSSAEFTAGRHRHPVRAGRDPQRRRQRGRQDRRGARRTRAASPRFKDFLRKVDGGRLQQADGRVADQGRRVRLPRPGPGRRWPTTTSGTSRPRSAAKRRRQGPGLALRLRPGRRPRSRSWTSSPGCPTRSAPSGRSRRCWPSSGTCSGSTSPTTRCSGSSTCWPGWSTRRSPG